MADVVEEAGLGLAGLPQLPALVVDLGVQRDHALVGGLQLAGQLVVERHHAAVGLLQLGVDGRERVPLGPHLAERGHQLAVLRLELVQCAAGDQAGQSPGERASSLVAEQHGRVEDGAERDHGAAVGTGGHRDLVHQPVGRVEAPAEPLVDLGVAGVDGHDRTEQGGLGELEGDGSTAGGQHVTGDLAERRRQPHRGLGVDAEGDRHLPAGVPGGEDGRVVADLEPQQLGHARSDVAGHRGSPGQTSTLASSRRTAASRSSVAATTSGEQRCRPG